MASLVGQQLKDTYDSLLKTSDNDALGGTYKEITDGSGNGSNLYLGTGGNLGIGNSSPARLLTIGDGTGSPNIQLLASTAGGSRIEFGDTDDSDVGEIQYVHGSSNYMQFTTNGTERLRITSSGNVGIGTDSPDTTLHLSASSNTSPVLRLERNDTFISANDEYGAIEFEGQDASSSPNAKGVRGSIRGIAEGGEGEMALTFSTADTYTTETEAMRIDSSGNVLVGTTATPTASAGNIVLNNGTAPTGNATDGVILYAEDVSTSSELKVRDEAGNVTTLSPHNFSLIPDGASEPMAWAYYSERDGKKINVDMLKLARMVESLTGEKLVYEQ